MSTPELTILEAVYQVREHCTDALPILTVYDRPADAPSHVVVRMFLNDKPTSAVWTFDSVAAARHTLSLTDLTPIARDPSDPPQVVESWL